MATLKAIRAKFPGLKDALVGVLVGAGLTKIYYETTGKTKDDSSAKQEEIDKIIEKNENLKSGKAFRTIDLTEETDFVDSSNADEFSKYGAPHSPVKFLKYMNHWVCYDQAKKIPIWVAEHLTRDKLKGTADREEANFTEDLNLPVVFQAHNKDYLRSGWNRGHMAPAGEGEGRGRVMVESGN